MATTVESEVLREALRLIAAPYKLELIPLYGVRDGVCDCGGGKDGKSCPDEGRGGTSRGKHPCISGWTSGAASNNSGQVHRWFASAFPNANLGVFVTDGLLVIDLDGPEKVSWWREQLERHGQPDTWMTKSGRPDGGYHVWFTVPRGTVVKEHIGPGIEVKGKGTDNGRRQVVVPPSLHYSGNRYQWIPGPSETHQGPAAAPAWLLELVTAPATSSPNGSSNGKAKYDNFKGSYGEPERHNRIVHAAGVLNSEAIPLDAAEVACLAFNREHCDPPKEESLVLAAVQDVYDRYHEQYGQGPRARPAAGEAPPTSATLPAFPVDALPDEARAYVERLATGGLPLEYLGPTALGVMAAAVGGLSDLQLAAGSWVEPLILWYGEIGLPGTGKTPAMQALRAPLDVIERPWREAYRERLAAWMALSTAERKKEPKPVSKRLLLGNHTFEKLIRILAPKVNRAGVLLLADELRSTISGLGQYKRGGGSDRADFLSLWSAMPISYDRVTDNTEIYVARPVVSLVGGIQPHLLSVLDGDDGLRDRFCLSWYSGTPTAELPEIQRADGEEWAWATLIERLAKKRDLERTRTLSGDAYEAFQAARARFRKVQINPQTPEHLASWASKAPSHLARHALLLAEAAGTGNVDLVAMRRAEQIVSYFGAHCRALPLHPPNLMVAPLQRGQDEAVDRLADYLRRQPDRRATRRDAQQARVAGARTAVDLERLIERYHATYPGCVVQEVAGGQPRQVLYAPGAQPKQDS